MNNKGFGNSRDTSSELIRSERNNQTLKTRIAELETTLRLAGPRERQRALAVLGESRVTLTGPDGGPVEAVSWADLEAVLGGGGAM